MHILYIIIAILNLAIGLFVFIKKPKTIQFIFLMTTIGTTIWLAGVHFVYTTLNIQYGRMAFIGAMITVTSGLLSVMHTPVFKKVSYTKYILILTTPIILTLLTFNQNFLSTKSSITDFGWLINFYIIFFIVYGSLSLYTLLKAYARSTHNHAKMQILYTFLGIFFFALPAIITNLILPHVFNIFSYNQYGPLFSIFMVGFIAYAITRHHLMDIRIAIQRGLVYTLLIGSIIFVFGILLFIAERTIGEYMQISHSVSGIITTVLGALYGQKLLQYFTEKTDTLFYKHPYNFHKAVGQIDAVMRKHIQKEEFIQSFMSTIDTVLHPESLSLFCFEHADVHNGTSCKKAIDIYSPMTQQTLQSTTKLIDLTSSKPSLSHCILQSRHKISMIVPITANGTPLAILCLGARKSSDVYTKKDKRLLTIATNYAGMALLNIKLYEEQQQYAKRLENTVAERTKDLQSLQQCQKQSMLDISHGIQGPLTLLRAELETQQMHASKNKGSYAKPINLVDKTSKLAYELIALARLNTIPQQAAQVPINITEVLSTSVHNLTPLAKEHSITLHYTAQRNVCIAGSIADMPRLCMNIIKNAIKYTSISTKMNKEIHINLTTNKQKSLAVLTVADNGIGIPKESLPRIFDTFYRVDDTAKVDGAGIGLTICQRIIQACNGTIEVESTIRKGTTFTIQIPLLSTPC